MLDRPKICINTEFEVFIHEANEELLNLPAAYHNFKKELFNAKSTEINFI